MLRRISIKTARITTTPLSIFWYSFWHTSATVGAGVSWYKNGGAGFAGHPRVNLALDGAIAIKARFLGTPKIC